MQPNTATFTCLLDGVGKAGRVDDAFGVLATMQQCAVAPNVATFTALLSACMHSSDAERAAHALQMMPSYGLDPAALPPHLLRFASGQRAGTPPRKLSPRGSPRGSLHGSPRGSPGGSPRGSPRGGSRQPSPPPSLPPSPPPSRPPSPPPARPPSPLRTS